MTAEERAEALETARLVSAYVDSPGSTYTNVTRQLASALIATEAERVRLAKRVEELEPSCVKLAICYMHDNHTFTPLLGGLDAVVSRARELGIESTYGMLGPARLVASNGVVIRSVGEAVPAQVGFAEDDLMRWRDAVMADADAVKLLSLASGRSE